MNFWGHIRVVFGSCWGHVLLNLHLQQLDLCNFKTQSKWSNSHVNEVINLGTLSVQFFDPAATTFGLVLLPDQLEQSNFWQWIWSNDHIFGKSTLWDHVRDIFGPCLDHVWPSITFSLSLTPPVSLLVLSPTCSSFTLVELSASGLVACENYHFQSSRGSDSISSKIANTFKTF